MIVGAVKKLASVLPVAMIALNLGAGIGSFVSGNTRSMIYWGAAAILNYCAAGFPIPRLPWTP